MELFGALYAYVTPGAAGPFPVIEHTSVMSVHRSKRWSLTYVGVLSRATGSAAIIRAAEKNNFVLRDWHIFAGNDAARRPRTVDDMTLVIVAGDDLRWIREVGEHGAIRHAESLLISKSALQSGRELDGTHRVATVRRRGSIISIVLEEFESEEWTVRITSLARTRG